MTHTTTISHARPRGVDHGHGVCSDVTAVRLELDGKSFITVCGCGWHSSAWEHVREAVVAWQRHRDGHV